MVNRRRRHRTAFSSTSARRPARPRWFPVLASLSLIFILAQPCGAADLLIESSDHGIKGFARKVPLIEVLNHLSDQTGYTVYVDETLVETPVSFEIASPVDPERAIRRIVHPHSNAMIYEQIAGTGEVRIQQIKVYSNGGRASRYVHVARGASPEVRRSYARGDASVQASVVDSKNWVSAGPEAVRQHVRPPLTITKDAMGLPGYRFRDGRKGMDDRPGANTAAKAYAQYRRENQFYQEGRKNAVLYDGRRSAQHAKDRYYRQRMQSIQRSIDHAAATR